MPISFRKYFPLLLLCGAYIGVAGAQEQADRPANVRSKPERALVAQYCIDCHNSDDKAGELALDKMGSFDLSQHTGVWEKVVRKLRARQMPPADAERPDEQLYETVLASLEGALDKLAAERPAPGRTATFRRLTRTEYQNAIRDLLALDVDVTALLPADDPSHGFDNVTVGDLSPTLMDRYITAAQKVSRLAVGRPGRSPAGDTIRVRADLTQEDHVEGLPLGTRGGALIPYNFPQEGEYEIQIRLARDRNEEVEGLKEPHELELLLDRLRVASFTVAPPPDGKSFQTVDAHLKFRTAVTAGPHKLGVTFVKNPSSLLETKRQPYQAHFNFHRHPRISPAIYQVSITGPLKNATGFEQRTRNPSNTGEGSAPVPIFQHARATADTPSRARLFVCEPNEPAKEEECATQILSTLARRAYRRPVTEADLETPMNLYRQARAGADFDAGIELAVSAILVNPNFLFRIEPDPPGAAPATAYRITDLELASRLSFFLWSSIPDDELLDIAERGELSQAAVLRQQVQRMLADSRAQSLVENFAGQWLHLRNLDSLVPDLRLFPDFDDNLRQSFRRETELLFESIMREDRSVLDMLKSDYTFLNERLAKHYGIPGVYGNRFRRVELEKDSVRGGLLRHGSILSVTSYATRTSPVIRGKWVLENIIGTPPPPPPENVPDLKDNTISSMLSVRERLAEHRANDACASCHNFMDPVGFALENYDAVGRWRTVEEGKPIDSTGGLPDGSSFDGIDGLEQALLKRPDVFVGTLAEKLLTFALGRGIEPFDGPAVRRIVRDAKAENYRFSSLIVGIATSTPFQMRNTE